MALHYASIAASISQWDNHGQVQVTTTHVTSCYHTIIWGPYQNKDGLSRYGIYIIKIRRSWDRLIFIMDSPILGWRHFNIEAGPRRPLIPSFEREWIMFLSPCKVYFKHLYCTMGNKSVTTCVCVFVCQWVTPSQSHLSLFVHRGNLSGFTVEYQQTIRLWYVTALNAIYDMLGSGVLLSLILQRSPIT